MGKMKEWLMEECVRKTGDLEEAAELFEKVMQTVFDKAEELQIIDENGELVDTIE